MNKTGKNAMIKENVQNWKNWENVQNQKNGIKWITLKKCRNENFFAIVLQIILQVSTLKSRTKVFVVVHNLCAKRLFTFQSATQ